MSRVAVRKATAADALDVLAWRNDPHTRAMSKTHEAVDEAQHLAWFAAAIADPRRLLLIGEADGDKIGMVRFDRGAETEVSINLNPACRGRGLSLPFLTAALALVEGDIWAEIRDENAASLRLFARGGFVFQSSEGGLGRYLRRAIF